MSAYLIGEIAYNPRITVQPCSEVVEVGGEGRLEWIAVRDTTTGADARRACSGLFLLLGAEPHCDWLPDSVARDARGFVLTGRDVPPAHWRDGLPPGNLETTLPGVFAAGDIRSGSMKRVAAASGEGASVVPLVHSWLPRSECARPVAGPSAARGDRASEPDEPAVAEGVAVGRRRGGRQVGRVVGAVRPVRLVRCPRGGLGGIRQAGRDAGGVRLGDTEAGRADEGDDHRGTGGAEAAAQGRAWGGRGGCGAGCRVHVPSLERAGCEASVPSSCVSDGPTTVAAELRIGGEDGDEDWETDSLGTGESALERTLHLVGHPMGGRVLLRSKPCDDSPTVGVGAVLAQLGLALDRLDDELDADDRAQLPPDVLRGCVVDRPGPVAARLVPVGEPRDDVEHPVGVVVHGDRAAQLDLGVVPGRHDAAVLGLAAYHPARRRRRRS